MISIITWKLYVNNKSFDFLKSLESYKCYSVKILWILYLVVQNLWFLYEKITLLTEESSWSKPQFLTMSLKLDKISLFECQVGKLQLRMKTYFEEIVIVFNCIVHCTIKFIKIKINCVKSRSSYRIFFKNHEDFHFNAIWF